jgi:23S rRNA (pseudouridine1915-N3)-methyltransferase
MKITLVVTGKTDSKWLQEGIDTFVNRLKHYSPIEIKVLPDLKNTRNMPVELQKEKEGLQMIPVLEGKNDIFLLDEGGKQLSSRELAAFLEKKMIAACRELIFVVGGPFGFSQQIENMATGKISLSRLTFSHQMVRLLFAEQLYRAFTIIRGEAYHND